MIAERGLERAEALLAQLRLRAEADPDAQAHAATSTARVAGKVERLVVVVLVTAE